jgi:hypothetical protein
LGRAGIADHLSPNIPQPIGEGRRLVRGIVLVRSGRSRLIAIGLLAANEGRQAQRRKHGDRDENDLTLHGYISCLAECLPIVAAYIGGAFKPASAKL